MKEREGDILGKRRVIDAVVSLLSSILINRQLVMLSVARKRAARCTVDRKKRGGRPAVRETFREGGSNNTHTIDEEREASLSHRVQAYGSKAARAGVAAGAAKVGQDWMHIGGLVAGHGVATPPTHGAQLAGDDVAAKSQLAPPAEKESATTTPLRRTAALDGNNTPHARASVFSCVGIGIIAASCSSGVVSAAACCCYPKLARAAFEPPDHLTNPRGEDHPTPSPTGRGWEVGHPRHS